MRFSLVALLLLGYVVAPAQKKTDSINLVHQFAPFYDLSFSAAEEDSMLDGLAENAQLFRKMHSQKIPNDLPYPFAFVPTVDAYQSPSQQSIQWPIPANISLPANKNDLAFYSILQLASLIKHKKISSVDLTRFFLARLRKWGDTLECVITITEERALTQARQADLEIHRGMYRGPLHGIPYGLKDLFSVAGYKTTWGAVPYKDQVIEEDAFVYKQLQKAGAVLCAKLTLGELAYADLWFGGKTRNPWNIKQGSSGSSAGSAAATVAGLLPFAIGTETWGSIISPSHVCGATGLRPTFGTVSRSGAMVLAWSLDKTGPICRSAHDAAIVYYYIKGTDGKDASARDVAFNLPTKVNWKQLKVGYAANYFKSLQSSALQWKVLEVFRKMGATLIAAEFPDSSVYPFAIMDPVIGGESAAAFDELTRSNQDDLIRRQDKNFWPNSFRVSRFVPAVEYINANRHRYSLMQAINKFMKDFDIMIVPTYAGNQLAITNLTGHPAICFPIGFTTSGVPTSITLLGNLYDEESIVAAAIAYQQHTDFHRKHPDKFRQ